MPERKSGPQTDGAESSPVPSKRSYSARLDEDLLAQLRASPKEERQKIGETIRAVQANFGRPHQHSDKRRLLPSAVARFGARHCGRRLIRRGSLRKNALIPVGT